MDDFVCEKLIPTDQDWAIIKELKEFYDVFRKPTVQAQADSYPTLHRTIPQIVILRRKLASLGHDNSKSIAKVAAAAAYKTIDDYFKKIMAIRAPAVAAVLNPRLRLYYFQRLLQDDSTAIRTFTRINNHFKNSYGAYKRQQREVEEAKKLDEEDTYGSNDSLIQLSFEDPTLEQLIDPFFNFEDDRVFNNASEESRYLAEKLVPIKTPKFDSKGKEVVEPDTAV
jgi:hypothetical protein